MILRMGRALGLRAIVATLCVALILESDCVPASALAPPSAFEEDKKNLPTVRLIAGQELAAPEIPRLERFLRYAARWLAVSKPLAKTLTTHSGARLIAGPGISAFWQKRWIPWLENLASTLEEAGVALQEIEILREHQFPGIPGAGHIHLKVKWKIGERSGEIMFVTRSEIPGGLILDTILSITRAYPFLSPSMLPIVVRFPRQAPYFDTRKPGTLYWVDVVGENTGSVLRSLRLYSELFRLHMQATHSPIPQDEALLHLLIFRARFFSRLSDTDREMLLYQLRNSTSNLDRLTGQTIQVLRSQPNVLSEQYNAATWQLMEQRVLENLRADSRRPSLFSKESPSLAKRFSSLDEAVLRHGQSLLSLQNSLLTEALAHAAATTSAPETNVADEGGKRGPKPKTAWIRILDACQRLLTPRVRDMLVLLPENVLRFLAAKGQVDTGVALISPSKAQKAISTKQQIKMLMKAKQKAKKRADQTKRDAAKKFKQETISTGLLKGVGNTAYHLGIAMLLSVPFYLLSHYTGIRTSILWYAYLAVIADYLAQVFAARGVNKLLVLISYGAEMINGFLTVEFLAKLDQWLPLGGALSVPFWGVILTATVVFGKYCLPQNKTWRAIFRISYLACAFVLFHYWYPLKATIMLPGTLIYLSRWLAADVLSLIRGRVFTRTRQFALSMQLACLQGLEEAIAIKASKRDPGEPLEPALQEIRRNFQKERKLREKRDERINQKYHETWLALRVPSELKHIAVANWVPPQYKPIVESISSPSFTIGYNWGSTRKGSFLPKEVALGPWYYIPFYPFIALYRHAVKVLAKSRQPLPFALDGHPPLVTSLLAELDNPNTALVLNAVKELGDLKYSPAYPYLVWVLENDPIEAVRLKAMIALKSTGNPEAIPALVRVMPAYKLGRLAKVRTVLDSLMDISLSQKKKLSHDSLRALIQILGDPTLGSKAETLIRKQGKDATLPSLQEFSSRWPQWLDRRRRQRIHNLRMNFGNGTATAEAATAVAL